MSPDRCHVPADIDLTDPELFASEHHYAVLERLRREAPVAWHPHRDGGFWVVSRHADLIRVSRDPESFSIEEGFLIGELAEGPFAALLGSDAIALVSDPPLHTRQRALIGPRFEASAVRALEPGIRARVSEQLAIHAGSGEVDFAQLVGFLPGEVIATLVGVPGADQDRVLGWLGAVVGRGGAAQQEAAAGIFAYAEELVARKRARLGEDIASDLIRAEAAGAPVTGRVLGVLLLLLVMAGSETTRSVACQGQVLLFENPEAQRRLLAEPELVPSAVEEMMRLASPVHYFRRTARRDAEIGGQRIAKGDKVTLWFGSANRDQAVFDAPHSFRVDRSPNPHVAFGEGTHYCLGAHLARLQLRVLFEELLLRFPELAPAGPAVRVRSNLINGIARMPVRLA